MSDSQVCKRKIRLFIADLDGTLVTPEKILTERSIRAVDQLIDRGIKFTITSGRPPRGMRHIIDRLRIDAPISAFNGGMFVRKDLSVIEAHYLPAALIGRIIAMLTACGLDVWVYQGDEWFIRDPQGPHVAREQSTVKFAPTVVKDYPQQAEQVVKIVGISDDHAAVARCEHTVREELGDQVSAARSQPYYLDVTNPQANKGRVVERLMQLLEISYEEIATIGDMPSDVMMFERDGLSIAMGNASAEVQAQADYVTTSNREEGFANAVAHCLLHLLE
ncbi:MAG TPA: Cof-type HAD-IIB family hydrolase [Armatimonadota bacterium]